MSLTAKGIMIPFDNAVALKARAITRKEKEPAFEEVRQGVITNTITKLRARAGINARIENETENAIISNGDFTIIIAGLISMKGDYSRLRTSVYRLFDALISKLSSRGGRPVVTLTINEYMELCGLRHRRSTKEQITADLEILLNMAAIVKAKKTRGKERAEGFIKLELCEKCEIKNGVIEFTLTKDFYKELLNYPAMPYPVKLWRININDNPHSYYFLRKLAEQKFMNSGKPNEDITTVRTLLDNAPYLPAYEEVKEAGRQIAQRIINPFTRDLDELSDTLIWQCYGAGNEPLRKEDLTGLSFQAFEELRIKTEWRDYPDQTARLAARKSKTA